jgi:hypothetical protein
MIQFALTKSIIQKFRNIIPFFGRMHDVFSNDCRRLLENANLMESLRAKGFDMAIMDPAFVYCYVMPYSLQIPYHASLSVPIYTLSYRVPRLLRVGSRSFGSDVVLRASDVLHSDDFADRGHDQT